MICYHDVLYAVIDRVNLYVLHRLVAIGLVCDCTGLKSDLDHHRPPFLLNVGLRHPVQADQRAMSARTI